MYLFTVDQELCPVSLTSQRRAHIAQYAGWVLEVKKFFALRHRADGQLLRVTRHPIDLPKSAKYCSTFRSVVDAAAVMVVPPHREAILVSVLQTEADVAIRYLAEDILKEAASASVFKFKVL